MIQEVRLGSEGSGVEVWCEGTSREFLVEALKKLHHQMSGIHLDLRTTRDHSAFVLSWKTSLWTIHANSEFLFYFLKYIG